MDKIRKNVLIKINYLVIHHEDKKEMKLENEKKEIEVSATPQAFTPVLDLF